MNIVVLSGNVTQLYDNGNNVRVSIADSYKDKTTFIPVTLYEKNADFARKYINKGDHISVEGKVGIYKGADYKEHMSIIALRVNFEGYKNPHKGQIRTHSKPSENFNEICDILETPFGNHKEDAEF